MNLEGLSRDQGGRSSSGLPFRRWRKVRSQGCSPLRPEPDRCVSSECFESCGRWPLSLPVDRIDRPGDALHSVAFLLLATYSRLGGARPPSMQGLARQLADSRRVARGTCTAYSSRLGDQPRAVLRIARCRSAREHPRPAPTCPSRSRFCASAVILGVDTTHQTRTCSAFEPRNSP